MIAARLVDVGYGAQIALALGGLAGQQVAAVSAATLNFAAARDSETLTRGFVSL